MLLSRRRLQFFDPVCNPSTNDCAVRLAADGFVNASERNAFTAEFDFPLKKSDNFPRASKNPPPKMFPKKTDTTIANEATFTLVHKFLLAL